MIKRKINLEVLNRIKISTESWDPQTKIKFVKNTNYLLYLNNEGYDFNSSNPNSQIKIINYKTSEIIYSIDFDRFEFEKEKEYVYLNCSNDGSIFGYLDINKEKIIIIPNTINYNEQFEINLDSNKKGFYSRLLFSNDNKYVFVIESYNTYKYDIQTRSLVNIIDDICLYTESFYSKAFLANYIKEKEIFIKLNSPIELIKIKSKERFYYDEDLISKYNVDLSIACISKDEKKLASLTNVYFNDDFENDTKRPLILIFDLESNQIIQEIYYDIENTLLDLSPYFENNFIAISYFYDDKFIIIGSCAVRNSIIYDAKTGEELYAFDGNGSGCFDFSEENKLLAMKTQEDEITIFKVSYQEEEINTKKKKTSKSKFNF